MGRAVTLPAAGVLAHTFQGILILSLPHNSLLLLPETWGSAWMWLKRLRLMGGIMVLKKNWKFGDTETQPVLPLHL